MGKKRDLMRASDFDRDLTIARLRAALEDGRLDLAEFDDRVQAVYAAKTYGELKVPVADLPGEPDSAPAVQAVEAQRAALFAVVWLLIAIAMVMIAIGWIGRSLLS